MTPTPTNRRAFLASGAVLAAGALLLPKSAGAEVRTTTPDHAAAFARIWAILTTPRKTDGMCNDPHCLACRAVKAKPYQCTDCGYVGVPLTMACTCATQTVSDQLWFQWAQLKKYPSAAVWPKDWQLTDGTRLTRTLARSRHRQLRALVARGAIGQCQGGGYGHPAAMQDLGGFIENCCHTHTNCPICDSTGPGSYEPSNDLLAVLREVNAVIHGPVTL